MKNLALISLKRAVWIVLLTAFLSNAKAIDVGAQEGKSNDNSPAGLEDIPEWLRSYPMAKPKVTYSSKSENSVYVSFRFRTNDAVNNVADYYQQKLQAAGLGSEKTIQQGFRGTEIAIQTPILKYPRIRINIGPEDNNQTEVDATYSHYSVSGDRAKNDREAINRALDKTFVGVLAIYGVILLVSIVLGALSTAFWIWMLIDCLTKESGEGNDKLIWALVIIFTHFVGAALYFFIRRPKRKAEFAKVASG